MSLDCAQRRVVITGMGVICPIGLDLDHFWENARGGMSGAAQITRFDTSKLPVKIGAEVKGFDLGKYLKEKKLGRFTLTVQYGLAAATLAVKDSGIDLARLDPDRTGVVEGTTISGSESMIRLRDSYCQGQAQLPGAASL